MTASISAFQLGALYSNDTISSTLGVGNAGGIRPSLNDDGTVRRVVLMTAAPTAKVIAENPYHDRIEDGILIYTGAALSGDQQPVRQNRRLVEQLDSRFPIWCFRQEFSRRSKSAGKNRWQFLGLVMLLRNYQERQLDTSASMRTVWVFEFVIDTQVATVLVDQDFAITSNLFLHPTTASILDRTPLAPEISVDYETELRLEQLRNRMLSVDPKRFESLIQTLLVKSGYESVVVTRYSQDGGIDVNAEFGQFGWPVRACRVQVQAKRWLHTVGRKEVAELRGSLQSDGIGCLITTSHFSKAAAAEAAEIGKWPITLINGRQLSVLIAASNIDPHNTV